MVERKYEFLVAIDSDGCAFDTMELKHKECFIPNTIKFYNLQAVSRFARQAAEFVNLYSKSRGVNRFPALVETLEWLQKRPEVRARQVAIEIPGALRAWAESEGPLSNPALEQRIEATGDPALRRALEWSQAVNRTIADMVHGVPPFPGVRAVLERLQGTADCIVCSATPNEALEKEWAEHGIDRYVAGIFGQEAGSKKETLRRAAEYPKAHSLMIGDAPGDYRAACANEALFFPILPGEEESSWQRLLDEGIDRLLGETFAGAYQAELLAEFERVLPERPPWPVVA